MEGAKFSLLLFAFAARIRADELTGTCPPCGDSVRFSRPYPGLASWADICRRSAAGIGADPSSSSPRVRYGMTHLNFLTTKIAEKIRGERGQTILVFALETIATFAIYGYCFGYFQKCPRGVRQVCVFAVD